MVNRRSLQDVTIAAAAKKPRLERSEDESRLLMMMIAFITFKSSWRVYEVQIHENLRYRGLDGIEPTT